jgi:GrpB-like predicted nucleotidyltransferase (UPF0157 family)
MIVEEYQSSWLTEFRALSEVLKEHLGALAVSIQHVGSTSIPGMLAKPTLDIDIEAAPKASVDLFSEKLGKLGYTYEGDKGISDRYAYGQSLRDVPLVTPARKWMSHHLYVCRSGSAELQRHVRFRDVLAGNPGLRAEYRDIKLACQARANGDRGNYQAAKDEIGAAFFRKVLSAAPEQRSGGAV